MVNGSLNEYVRAQLQRGYPPEAIRNALLQAGYNPQDVEFAIRLVSRQAPQRMLVVGGRNLAIAIAGILAVILLVMAGIAVFLPSQKDIQISLSIGQQEILPGGTIALTANFASEQKRVVPVDIDYVVSDTATRNAVTTRSSRLEVGKSAIDTQSIFLPETISPGDYELRLTARFESISRIQTARFTVQPAQPALQANITEVLKPLEEAPVPEEACPGGCDDLNPATEDICEQGNCVHMLKANVCGNGECEPGENKLLCPQDCGGAAEDKEAVKEQALSVAKNDPEKAATICTTLVIPEDTDPCFAAIANASKKSALCTNIQDLRARDNCLMEFAFSGDYTVCDQLNNRYFITSCQSLARFSTAQQTQAEIEQEAKKLQEEAAAE